MDFGLVKKGLLMLCRTQHALHEEAKTAAQAIALGIPAEVLDAKQTAALDPAMCGCPSPARYIFRRTVICSRIACMVTLQSAA